MTNRQLRILLLEDDSNDALLITRALKGSELDCVVTHIDQCDQILPLFQQQQHDVILSDYQLVGCNARQILQWYNDCKLDLPFILLSGFIAEEDAVVLFRNGVHDFISKNSLARLAPAITREYRDFCNREDKRQTLRELGESEYRYRSLVEISDAGIGILDDQQIYFMNQRGYQIICGDMEPEPELMRSVLLQSIRSQSKDESMELQAKEVAISCHTGDKRYLLLSSKRIEYRNRPALHILFQDISATHLLRQKLKLWQELMEHASEGVTATDAEGNIILVNRAFTRITGYSLEEVVGKNPRILQSGKQDEQFYREMWEVLQREGLWQGEIWNKRKNGEIYPEWLSISVIENDAGEITNYMGIFSDISEKDQTRRKIEYLTHYEQITGLGNRAFLSQQIGNELQRLQHRSQKVPLLIIAIDNFQELSQAYTTEMRNAVLLHVCETLQQLFGTEYQFAHISLGEFAAIGNFSCEVNEMAEDARKILQCLHQSFRCEQQEVFLDAHIGIAILGQDGTTADDLIRNVQIAVSQGKTNAHRISFFESGDDAKVFHLFFMQQALHSALKNDELELYYQPKLSLLNGQIVSCEALMRWNHKSKGMMPPSQFIPIAEETGMILQLGERLIEIVCKQLRSWIDDTNIDPIKIALNVSTVQILQQDVLALLLDNCDKYQVPHHWIQIEITETGLIQDPDRAMRVVNDIRAEGFTISIDDFGTGYSSLSYLKNFPVDEVKIDRSFITDVTENAKNGAIVRSIIGIARELHCKVVAEGIETHGQLAYLRRAACDQMQGYLFSQPVPIAEFNTMLQEGRFLDFTEIFGSEQQRHLLVVDDEQPILNSIRRLLRHSGYTVHITTDIHQALDWLSIFEIGVVISDQRMPEMSGDAFLAKVRAIHPETVRILLTGYTDVDALARAVNNGSVYRFVTKPWDEQQLLDSINDAFKQHDFLRSKVRF